MNGRPASLFRLIALLILTLGFPLYGLAGLSFTVETYTADGANSVAVGDFNGDGHADLAVVTAANCTVTIFLNNGDGTFTTGGAYSAGTGAESVVVGDLNNDGNLDLAIADFGNVFTQTPGGVSILLGNGDGTFQPATSVVYPSGTYPYFVATADFNLDGDLDLAVANGLNTTDQGNPSVTILLGNGDGTFQAPTTYSAGENPVYLAAGDLSGDGIPDLVVGSGSTVQVLVGNGDGTFQNAVGYTAEEGPLGVALGDFNGDGNLDVAAATGGSGDLLVFLGNGDGTLQPALYNGVVEGQAIAAGDINNAGYLDLVAANTSSDAVSIFLGNGSGTFQTALQRSDKGVYPLSLALAEFNGSGELDIALVGSNSLVVFLNTTPEAPAATLSASQLAFPTQTLGQATAPMTATLTNTGNATLNITAVTPSNSEFAETNNCGASLAPSKSCTFTITFTPAHEGTRNGSVTITDNAGKGSQKLALQGAGTGVRLQLSSLSFGDQMVGTASHALSTLASNITSATVDISGFTVTNSDFTETNTCGNSLAPGAICTISVTFKPRLVGNAAGQLQIGDSNGGAPQIISLSGTGVE